MIKLALSVLIATALSTVFYVSFAMQNCLTQLSAFEFKYLSNEVKDDVCYYKAIGFNNKAENLLLHSVFESINSFDDNRARR